MGAALPLPPTGLTPAQATGLVLLRPEKRTASDIHALAPLSGLHAQVQSVLASCASFAALIREPPAAARAPAQLQEQWQEWIARALSSDVLERTAFATKLQQESPAACMALILPFSQGQTEGQVNRVKVLKRQMYGRVKFTRFGGQWTTRRRPVFQ
jgi:transposase